MTPKNRSTKKLEGFDKLTSLVYAHLVITSLLLFLVVVDEMLIDGISEFMCLFRVVEAPGLVIPLISSTREESSTAFQANISVTA